jgi:flagellar assembly protein FliH
MSRVWGSERAEGAASLGSFVIRRSAASFRAWGTEAEGGAGNDPAFSAEDEATARENQAYSQGLVDGRRSVEAEIAAERSALTELAASLPNLKPEPVLPLAMLLAETVDRLVREIVGEVEIDGLKLLARAKAAAAVIGEATQPASLRVNPKDVELLKGAGLAIAVEADESLPRGTLLLETAEGWVEDGPAVRLDRLRAELDRVAASR